FQHIKTYNIRLLEVMSLAVFPPRLKDEPAEINELLLNKPSDVAGYHQEWAQSIKEKHGTISTPSDAELIMKQELGRKFSKVLEDCGVFKEKSGFDRFIRTLNK